MADGPRPHATIHIRVHTAAAESMNAGTFTAPEPKVNLNVGTEVSWNLLNPRPATFEVLFQGFTWPFAGPVTIINNDTPPLYVVNRGSYHYAVKVDNVEGGPYIISGCPEIEI